jgi:hypothetical protein
MLHPPSHREEARVPYDHPGTENDVSTVINAGYRGHENQDEFLLGMGVPELN